MTLEQAVAVLNRERHDGRGNWEVWTSRSSGMKARANAEGSGGRSSLAIDFTLNPYEAIAIAEKYERERSE